MITNRNPQPVFEDLSSVLSMHWKIVRVIQRISCGDDFCASEFRASCPIPSRSPSSRLTASHSQSLCHWGNTSSVTAIIQDPCRKVASVGLTLANMFANSMEFSSERQCQAGGNRSAHHSIQMHIIQYIRHHTSILYKCWAEDMQIFSWHFSRV